MTTAPLPAVATRAEFARIAGFKPAYVTQLARDGRIVLADNGRDVRVSESLALIRNTADPSRAGVAARHAATRGAATAAASTPEGDDQLGDDDDDGAPATSGGSAYQRARTRREEAQAAMAERDLALSLGQLLRVDDVREVVSRAGTELRNALELLPDRLAPSLAAEPDEARCRALLAEAVEMALEEAARALTDLGKSNEGTP